MKQEGQNRELFLADNSSLPEAKVNLIHMLTNFNKKNCIVLQ